MKVFQRWETLQWMRCEDSSKTVTIIFGLQQTQILAVLQCWMSSDITILQAKCQSWHAASRCPSLKLQSDQQKGDEMWQLSALFHAALRLCSGLSNFKRAIHDDAATVGLSPSALSSDRSKFPEICCSQVGQDYPELLHPNTHISAGQSH